MPTSNGEDKNVQRKDGANRERAERDQSAESRLDRNGNGDNEHALNPRIVRSLNTLYDDIISDPLPDSITAMLERLRREESKLKSPDDGAENRANDDRPNETATGNSE